MAPTTISECHETYRAMFPDPERPVWEQFFSKRHQQSYEGRLWGRSDAEVFRIFQRANFSRLTDVEGHNQPVDTFLDPKDTIPQLWYDRFLPSLVLATRLIKATPEFFCILAFGKLGRFDDGSWGYARDKEGKWRYELEEGADPKSKCQELFDKMSNIRFFTGKTPKDMDHAYATAAHGYWPFDDSSKRIATAAVQLHVKWMNFFSRPDYDDISANMKNRILVHLAMVLVHELAHVWYGYRKLEYARQGNFDQYFALVAAKENEPYFYGDEEHAEIGHAWGRYAFDCEQQLDRCLGLCYTESTCLRVSPYGRWQEGETREKPGGDSDESSPIRVLDPCLVEAFLSKDCWDFYDTFEGDHRKEEHSESLYILERMEEVVAFGMFTTGIGRTPSMNELRLQVLDNNFVEERIRCSVDQSLKQAGLPPTPPPSPPATPIRAAPAKARKVYTDTLMLRGGKIVCTKRIYTDTLVYFGSQLINVIHEA